MIVIGLCGLIGSGKDTAAEYLVTQYGFKRLSFAESLKDALAAMLGWDRVLLEGLTEEARRWREQVDVWWANRLNIPQFTPRFALQQIGTNVLRQHFHDDIWVACLENKLRKLHDNVVISDVRFPNEIDSIHRMNGKLVRVKRNDDPAWYKVAADKNNPNSSPDIISAANLILTENAIHPSEYSWAEYNIDYTIENNGSKFDFHSELEKLLASIY